LAAGRTGAAPGPGAAGAGAVAALPAPTIRSVAVSSIDEQVTLDDGSRVSLDRRVTIEGGGFFGTSFGPDGRLHRADGRVIDAPLVIMENARRIVASPPAGTYGDVTLVVENPDHRSATFAVGL